MAYAYVQNVSAANGSGATLASGAWGVAVTAGNCIAYCVAYGFTSEVTASLAGNSNTYTEVGHFYDGVSQNGMRWGYAQNVNAGTTGATVTFGNSGVSFTNVQMVEYSGLKTSAVFGSGEENGGVQASVSGSANAVTSGNMTPVQQPAALVGWSYELSGTAPSAGSGTDRGTFWNQGAGAQMRLQDQRLTSYSSVASTFTAGTAGDTVLTVALILRETGAVAASGVFRKTLSGIGGRIGTRQLQS